MPINFPPTARNAFDGNMNDRTAVELPFPCPPFFIVNGDEKLEALKNVQYFGGFACGAEKLQFAAEHWQDIPFPIPAFQKINLAVKGGVKVEVLASRSLIVAPIGIREYSSIKSDTGRKRVAPFTKGARPGIQALCVLGCRDEQNVIHPWAPVMLTASGYQVNHLKEAFASWRKAIKPLVQKLIPEEGTNSTLNLFWMFVGTFGERKQEIVGKGSDSQFITPVTSYIPDDLDEKKVESLYVGYPVAEFMADLSNQSKEWLSVFAKMTQPGQQPRQQAQPNFDEPPPPYDSDYPF